MQGSSKSNVFLIAGALIVAGIVIALGIIAAGNGGGAGGNGTPQQNNNLSAMNIPAVSADDHIMGSVSAAVTMVEYSDVGCVHCQRLHSTMNQIVGEYEGDRFAWVFRHLPLRDPDAALASECVADISGEEGFWAYLNHLMEQAERRPISGASALADTAVEVAGADRDAFLACFEDEQFEDKIAQSIEDAGNAGASGTPFNVFILQTPASASTVEAITTTYGANAVFSEDATRLILPGALPYQNMKSLIDLLLQDASTATPPTDTGE